MNYELAKQLKEAGFKAKKTTGGYFDQDGESKYYPSPELSELIEACGEEFRCLFSPLKESVAWLGVPDDLNLTDWIAEAKQIGIFAEGKTPSEAVARLWLKLNGKLDQ